MNEFIFIRVLMTCMFALMGLILLYITMGQLREAYQSVYWPTVEGQIVESELVEINRGVSHHYRTQITYKFIVDGQDYLEDRVFFDDKSSSKSSTEHQLILDRYPKGKKVLIYYNSSSPQRSFLEPGLKMNVIVEAFFLGAVFMVLSSLFAFGFLKVE